MSVILKMEAVRSSETSEHSSTTRCRNPKEEHQLTKNGREGLQTYYETSHDVVQIIMTRKYSTETGLSSKIIKMNVKRVLV
jgi:hypothetical protein